MKQTLYNYLKNFSGWRSNRKLVIFSIDDYGNVRLNSKESLNRIEAANIPLDSHFDRFDTLETRADLEDLFDVLSSVKDKHENPAIFTPYSLPCNIDFDSMANNKYTEYIYELLPETYEKLTLKDTNAYAGTWELWKDGIKKGLMKPQFHGREHFNMHIFKDLLKKKDKDLITVLKQHSHVTIPGHKSYKNGWTAAYSFDKLDETFGFLENVADGVKAFKRVYGYAPNTFTPPAQQFPLHLENELYNLGFEFIDRPRSLKRYLGDGKYQMEKHRLGGGTVMKELVRNVVFEPTTPRITNWVDFSFKQIEAAFKMKKPANISSHRVNFCGHIDEENRKVGLSALKQLLDKIVNRWPDVEFISADQLGDIISKEKIDE
ncbi:hypothetical protein [Gelidibacter maritimus]|uniref:Polysaccharide (De)acetylase n=1 Tax=Gelidibacter maritimus TaxID=2761487 RepID=A0A7W2M628_9FLAO|nr:hypothetical protein [Gelidibacter maritimus]MBA6153391.1 hypothetical protein [Gelidibacter maritimus]